MDLSSYQFLIDYIPSIKSIIEKEKIAKDEKKCLDYICNYYKNDLRTFNKNLFRNNLKAEREKFEIKKLKNKSLTLNKKLISSNEFKKAEIVFCFISFDNEIDTFHILKECLNKGKKLAVPKIINNSMTACGINDLENLKENKFGILEPLKFKEISKEYIDLAVVPGLAFNSLGYRIGYGKGYYDKFLYDFKGKSIGIILKEFIVDFIPDKFDMPVNIVLSV